MSYAKPVSPASAEHTSSTRLTPRALVVMSLVLAMTWIGLAGSASAQSRKSSAGHPTLTLRTKFTRFGSGGLVGGGRYVLVYGSHKGVLVDTRSAHRTTVSEPDCFNAVIGGSSIVFQCFQGSLSSSYELYSITTGQSRVLNVSPGIASSYCDGPPASCATVTAVGADWIAFERSCSMEHCGPRIYVYQNLATGTTEADPSGPMTTVDLSSPTLRRTLCTPVTVPSDNLFTEHGLPSVSVEGRYAIATSQGGSYLEQCGSRLHEFLTYTSYPGCAHGICAPPANSHVIVWESKPRRLSGIFLPSRQRFTIPVPAKVDPAPGMYVNGDQYSLALTPRALYVEIGGTVWTTSMPSAPPRVKRSFH